MVVGKSPCTKIKCINFCPIFPIYLNLNGIVLRIIYIDLNMKKCQKLLSLTAHASTSSTQQAAPPRIMHLQFSMQKKVCIVSLVQLGGEKRTFSIEAGEGGACVKIALWKTNLWSRLFLCVLFSGCGFYASFWREIRIWCKIFFKPFAWINSERRRGMVLSFVIWSGVKSASSDPPLVQSYYVSGGKQTAMLGRVTLLYQELSFNFYSVPVPVA